MADCSGVNWATPGAFLVGPIIVGLQTKILIYTLPNVKKKKVTNWSLSVQVNKLFFLNYFLIIYLNLFGFT